MIEARRVLILNASSEDQAKYDKPTERCVCLQTLLVGASHITHPSHSRPAVACKSDLSEDRECPTSLSEFVIVCVAGMMASYTDDDL